MPNTICHVEFMSADLAASSRFYQQIFSWHAIPMGEEYMVWSPGEGETGGGFSMEIPGGQRTVVYISVEDIEAKLGEIETAGGAMLVPKTQISKEHGYFALFKDPHGTVLGLWSES
jgi:predicted enzyme related to lactoylglutathione lyase